MDRASSKGAGRRFPKDSDDTSSSDESKAVPGPSRAVPGPSRAITRRSPSVIAVEADQGSGAFRVTMKGTGAVKGGRYRRRGAGKRGGNQRSGGGVLKQPLAGYKVPDETASNEDDEDDMDFVDLVCAKALSDFETRNSNSVTEDDETSIPGFDISAGDIWIYPTNKPIRDYQFNIAHTALFSNTFVSLPTGLGKTFIAAVVMFNFHRWYPDKLIVFMAPTRPLVAQQLEACQNIMGILPSKMIELTGQVQPKKREEVWKEKKVFFLTPQVMLSDLERGYCRPEEVRLIVVDEAHKAQGNYAYVPVIAKLTETQKHLRILALSATPGNDTVSIQEVFKNLLISRIELRSEASPDILPYSRQKEVETVVVQLDDNVRGVYDKLMQIFQGYTGKLLQQNVISNRGGSSLTQFQLLKCRETFRSQVSSSMPAFKKGLIELDFATAITLAHTLELLSIHGLRSFYSFLNGVLLKEKGHGQVTAELKKNTNVEEILNDLQQRLNISSINSSLSLNTSGFLSLNKSVSENVSSSNDAAAIDYTISHPKFKVLRETLLKHFKDYEAMNKSTRAMVFSQYRDSVQEIGNMLNTLRPQIKPMIFIGQSSSGGAGRGLKQKEQIQVVQKFREGGFNVLVSTSVGEEGLDIGEVDLIVCFDCNKSPTRLIQRMGRTGRKREGRTVFLLTHGKEEAMYRQSVYQCSNISKNIIDEQKLEGSLFKHSPRMIPKGMQPQCFKMDIILSSEQDGNNKIPVVQEKSEHHSVVRSDKVDAKSTLPENGTGGNEEIDNKHIRDLTLTQCFKNNVEQISTDILKLASTNETDLAITEGNHDGANHLHDFAHEVPKTTRLFNDNEYETYCNILQVGKTEPVQSCMISNRNTELIPHQVLCDCGLSTDTDIIETEKSPAKNSDRNNSNEFLIMRSSACDNSPSTINNPINADLDNLVLEGNFDNEDNWEELEFPVIEVGFLLDDKQGNTEEENIETKRVEDARRKLTVDSTENVEVMTCGDDVNSCDRQSVISNLESDLATGEMMSALSSNVSSCSHPEIDEGDCQTSNDLSKTGYDLVSGSSWGSTKSPKPVHDFRSRRSTIGGEPLEDTESGEVLVQETGSEYSVQTKSVICLDSDSDASTASDEDMIPAAVRLAQLQKLDSGNITPPRLGESSAKFAFKRNLSEAYAKLTKVDDKSPEKSPIVGRSRFVGACNAASESQTYFDAATSSPEKSPVLRRSSNPTACPSGSGNMQSEGPLKYLFKKIIFASTPSKTVEREVETVCETPPRSNPTTPCSSPDFLPASPEIKSKPIVLSQKDATSKQTSVNARKTELRTKRNLFPDDVLHDGGSDYQSKDKLLMELDAEFTAKGSHQQQSSECSSKYAAGFPVPRQTGFASVSSSMQTLPPPPQSSKLCTQSSSSQSSTHGFPGLGTSSQSGSAGSSAGFGDVTYERSPRYVYPHCNAPTPMSRSPRTPVRFSPLSTSSISPTYTPPWNYHGPRSMLMENTPSSSNEREIEAKLNKVETSRYRRTHKNPFINDEASVTWDDSSSGCDGEASGVLDKSVDSFVVDEPEDTITESQQVRYLTSMKDIQPLQGRVERPLPPVADNLVLNLSEAEYESDSFCVRNDIVDYADVGNFTQAMLTAQNEIEREMKEDRNPRFPPAQSGSANHPQKFGVKTRSMKMREKKDSSPENEAVVPKKRKRKRVIESSSDDSD